VIIPLPWAGAIAAGALLAGIGTGYKVAGWRCAASMTEALQEAENQRAAMQAKADTAAIQYEATRNDNASQTRDTATAVRTVYRDRLVAADCAVDPAARSLLQRRIDQHNAHNSGGPESILPANSDTARPAD